MKYLLLSFILLLNANNLLSQVNLSDSFPIYNDDYSNRQYVNNKLLLKEFSKSKEETLVIINKKFYKIDDKVFTNLDKNKIKKLEIINDEYSKTKIKHIIIITI